MCTTIKTKFLGAAAVVALVGGTSFSALAGSGYGGPYGFGSPADPAAVAIIDIDVVPDGRGAPPGEGTYEQGKMVYAEQCSACHGDDMASPVKGTGAAPLRGGRGTLASEGPKKTVESYWPYASTLYDYVRRAMPFNAPGSLSNDDVYAVVAYVLGEGEVVDKGMTMNADALAAVEMPNRDGFVPDPRPDVHNYE